MQRLIKSMTGSSPSSTSIQKSMTEAQDGLQKTKGYLQFTREHPEIQTFETTAKYVQQVANETAKVAAAIQQYGTEHRETLNIALQQALTTQLQDAITSAQVSSTRISEGIEAARAHTYPEAIVYYTDQVAGTIEAIATLQGQLVQLMSDIQAMVDTAEGEKRAIDEERKQLPRLLALRFVPQISADGVQDILVCFHSNYGPQDHLRIIEHLWTIHGRIG